MRQSQNYPLYERFLRNPGRSESLVRDRLWKKLKTQAARLPFAEQILAAYYCARDPETPVQSKAILFAALAYFVMPLDTIPDFIAGLGFTDDAAVLFLALNTLRKDLAAHHYEAARRALARLRHGLTKLPQMHDQQDPQSDLHQNADDKRQNAGNDDIGAQMDR